MKTHETVGWQYRGWDGLIYLCTRYDRAAGFWMRVVRVPSDADPLSTRCVGDEVCISERAIDRTYRKTR